MKSTLMRYNGIKKKEEEEKMEFLKLEWIGIVFFFLILVTIQYTLNKVVVLLHEIIRLLQIKK